MRILIVTPAPARSLAGNRITAKRWARFLRELGHRVTLAQEYKGQSADLLVALHARKSAGSVRRFRNEHPHKPLVLALTGTDLYRDIHKSARARRSLELADRLVVLQPHAVEHLSPELQPKGRVIYQSVAPPRTRPEPLKTVFEVCVIGHLRPVKDPFRAAKAARRLPAESRIRVHHLGAALSESMERQACAEMRRNPRYRWRGQMPHWKTRRYLTRSRLLVVSSKLEGGANVVSEALAAGTPVVSSRISGSIGLLGKDYPGYFPVGDTEALAALLERTETDPAFYDKLKSRCAERADLVTPERERTSWRQLLDELGDLQSG